MFAPTYLDHNATTPLDPRVREAMLPYLDARFGNPSSRHEYGRQARAAVDRAREQVAAAVGAHPTEVVFTSGGSEANNLFIKGAAAQMKPGLIVVGASEHPCVREPARQLERSGWRRETALIDGSGRIRADVFAELMKQSPRLVSVMAANNETGVLQEIDRLAAEARAAGALFHTDAVQALGKMPISFRALAVSAMTISSHKIHGPLGAGALVLDKRVELAPLVAGGGQERGLRSGTENVAAIVGFGAAAELAVAELNEWTSRAARQRDALEASLLSLGAWVFGAGAARLPNTAFFAFDHVDGETLVAKLDRAGFAVASGSACSSADPRPSATLLAMGVEDEVARGAIRVSLGRDTQDEALARFVKTLGETLQGLRTLSAVAV
ncbi:cysteine desulfurase family protein [Niveibacterium microcysteis]|uniref:Cysteine desulfurase n=1 Tax=Niveibacterium microcysteis TaxID=2811415 RepID=A0ABX7M170_9RHOO|nr:cysteine desulfurase family protein [Niveibacterium microcysteis]QSI75161.1 cysteine desulfurase [Niveibacterium microcysteis]